ncbi:MAG: hypothetical protein R3B96_02065 [Pirellulaceae bacterium]
MFVGIRYRRVVLALVACLLFNSALVAQERTEILDFVPSDAPAAIWTDDLTVTTAPVSTHLLTWIERLESSLKTLDETPANEQLREQFEPLLEDLTTIQDGLAVPFFDGPCVAFQLPTGETLIVARCVAARDELEKFLSAVERLTLTISQYTTAAALAEEGTEEPAPGGTPSGHWELVDDWLVWSDSEDALEAFTERLTTNQWPEPLTESREFQTIRANLPRGERGSWRFHFDADMTQEVFFALWRGADHEGIIFDDETRPYLWVGTGLSELRGLGGQWTLFDDERWDGSAPRATLEAFAIQALPLRGLAAAMSPGRGFELDQVAPHAPHFSFYFQLLFDGPSLHREAIAGARRAATPIALENDTTVDELLSEFWDSTDLGWSFELSEAFESLSFGQQEGWKTIEDSRNTYNHAALRFRDTSAAHDRLGALVLSRVAGYGFDSPQDKMRHLVEDGIEYWEPTDEFFDAYYEKFIKSQIETPFSEQAMKQMKEQYAAAIKEQTGAEPTEAQLNARMAEVQAAHTQRIMDDWQSTREALNWRVPFENDWLNFVGNRPDYEPLTHRMAFDQLIALEDEIDTLRSATAMRSQPVFVIATWNDAGHSLAELHSPPRPKEAVYLVDGEYQAQPIVQAGEDPA